MTEPIPSHEEIERQFRVLRQTLDMHGFMKDRFSSWAQVIQISLLACSVVFCATTFASDELYKWLGLEPTSAKYVQGLVSVIAFAVSVSLLVVDVRGKAALHGAAVDRFTRVVSEFRQVQSTVGDEWPTEHRKRLHDSYWTANKESTKIPNARFIGLKAKHLRKVEISTLKSRYAGCPQLILCAFIRCRDTFRAFQEFRRGETGKDVRTNPPQDQSPG